MDPIPTLHPLARAWLLDGPLSADLEAYLALLERGRYAEGSVEKHLRALAHFSHWMTRCRLAAEHPASFWLPALGCRLPTGACP